MGDFTIMNKNNGIIIFPIGEGYLTNLFEYTGTIKIHSVIATNDNLDKITVSVSRIMDYSELLGVSESLTRNSEDMDSTHTIKKSGKHIISSRIISNLNTSAHDVLLYLSDKTLYSGYFHIHLDTGSCMTGKEHTKESKDLYIVRQGNDKLISTEYRRIQKER